MFLNNSTIQIYPLFVCNDCKLESFINYNIEKQVLVFRACVIPESGTSYDVISFPAGREGTIRKPVFLIALVPSKSTACSKLARGMLVHY